MHSTRQPSAHNLTILPSNEATVIFNKVVNKYIKYHYDISQQMSKRSLYLITGNVTLLSYSGQKALRVQCDPWQLVRLQE